jgi:hypothetical protein
MTSLPQKLLLILRDICSFYSPTGKEQEIAAHCASAYFRNDRWVTEIDEKNNLMIWPAGMDEEPLPLINCHSDVHPYYTDETDIPKLKKAAASLYIDGDFIVRPDIPLQMGFDDRAGLAVALGLADTSLNIKPFKALITSGEERGRTGCDYAIKHSPLFFRNVPWGITVDRAGGHDCVYIYKDQVMAPDPMLAAIEEISARVMGSSGMKRCSSPNMADSFNISRDTKIPIVNLSCGIVPDTQHGRSDKLNFTELVNTFNVVRKCLESPTILGDGRELCTMM